MFLKNCQEEATRFLVISRKQPSLSKCYKVYFVQLLLLNDTQVFCSFSSAIFFEIYQLEYTTFYLGSCQRPYHAEHTGSRPITEVKQHRASSVLGWETAWEHGVLLAFYFFQYMKWNWNYRRFLHITILQQYQYMYHLQIGQNLCIVPFKLLYRLQCMSYIVLFYLVM